MRFHQLRSQVTTVLLVAAERDHIVSRIAINGDEDLDIRIHGSYERQLIFQAVGHRDELIRVRSSLCLSLRLCLCLRLFCLCL